MCGHVHGQKALRCTTDDCLHIEAGRCALQCTVAYLSDCSDAAACCCWLIATSQCTVVTVEGKDKAHLLMSITGGFSSAGLTVVSASITSDDGRVLDVFRVQTNDGQKVRAAAVLQFAALPVYTTACSCVCSSTCAAPLPALLCSLVPVGGPGRAFVLVKLSMRGNAKGPLSNTTRLWELAANPRWRHVLCST